jgi:hypothetical protein
MDEKRKQTALEERAMESEEVIEAHLLSGLQQTLGV